MNIKILVLAVFFHTISSFKLLSMNFRHSASENKIPDRIYAA